jgi:hypothetical protein
MPNIKIYYVFQCSLALQQYISNEMYVKTSEVRVCKIAREGFGKYCTRRFPTDCVAVLYILMVSALGKGGKQ